VRPTKSIKDAARAQIEAQTRAFLESGGKVNQQPIRPAELGKTCFKSFAINPTKPDMRPSKCK
jgi:hypothetical protein